MLFIIFPPRSLATVDSPRKFFLLFLSLGNIFSYEHLTLKVYSKTKIAGEEEFFLQNNKKEKFQLTTLELRAVGTD